LSNIKAFKHYNVEMANLIVNYAYQNNIITIINEYDIKNTLRIDEGIMFLIIKLKKNTLKNKI